MKYPLKISNKLFKYPVVSVAALMILFSAFTCITPVIIHNGSMHQEQITGGSSSADTGQGPYLSTIFAEPKICSYIDNHINDAPAQKSVLPPLTSGGNHEIYMFITTGFPLPIRFTAFNADCREPSILFDDFPAVVFASNADGDYDIYITNPIIEDNLNITNNNAEDRQPTVLIDEVGPPMMAFASNMDGNFDIYLMNLDTGAITNLTSNHATNLSPYLFIDDDGPATFMVYASNIDGDYDIYMMNLFTSEIVNLTANDADDLEPSVYVPLLLGAPLMAFSSNADGDYEIYIMDLDTREIEKVTDNNADDRQPDIGFIDEEFIFLTFISDIDGNYDVYLMDPETCELFNMTDNNADNQNPRWNLTDGFPWAMVFVSDSQSRQISTATGTGIAKLQSDKGYFMTLNVAATTDCPPMPGYSFPHGFFGFEIWLYDLAYLINPSPIVVTITLPSNMPVGTQYWKCLNGVWVDLTPLLGDNDGDNILTLTLTDGGLGDGDGEENFVITDPGGPAVLTSSQKTSYLDLDKSSPQMEEHRLLLPADLNIKYLNVQPQQARVDEPVIVYANITNSGDETGNYIATLKINGKMEQVQQGQIKGHSAIPLKFTVYKDKPGNYSVDVNGQQSSFTLIDSIKTIDSARNLLIIVLAVCSVLIIVLLILLLRRNSNRSEIYPE
jgi:hypothetical protein